MNFGKRTAKEWSLLIYSLLLAALLLSVVVDKNKRESQLNELLAKKTEELSWTKDILAKKTKALSKCINDQFGVDDGFIPLYESVEDAYKIEFTFYSEDTDSGEPRKFSLACGGGGKKK